MIVALDTAILIWGVQGRSSENRTDKIAHARALLQHLQNQKHTVIVPLPSAFEVLLRVPVERQAEVMGTMQQRFKVLPFDARAAVKNAEIWVKRNGGPKLSDDVRSRWPEATKAELRFDCQIVAIAAANGAEVLYSEDHHVNAFANGIVKVLPIPETKEQLRLF